MAESNNNSSGGIGLAGIVFIVFLVLKLAEVGPVAEWSWWWVTSPLWGVFVLIGGMLLCVGAVAAIREVFVGINRRRRVRRMLRDD